MASPDAASSKTALTHRLMFILMFILIFILTPRSAFTFNVPHHDAITLQAAP
jgi:hypothetical protein